MPLSRTWKPTVVAAGDSKPSGLRELAHPARPRLAADWAMSSQHSQARVADTHAAEYETAVDASESDAAELLSAVRE